MGLDYDYDIRGRKLIGINSYIPFVGSKESWILFIIEVGKMDMLDGLVRNLD